MLMQPEIAGKYDSETEKRQPKASGLLFVFLFDLQSLCPQSKKDLLAYHSPQCTWLCPH